VADHRDPVSVTFDCLAALPAASALRILVSALEEPNTEIREHAVSALLSRGETAGLRALVRAAHVLGPARRLLIEAFDILIPALRETMHDSWPQARLNAVDLAADCGDARLASLPAQALGDPETAVREKAAAVLLTWARDLAADWRASRDIPGARDHLRGQRSALLVALWEAFRTYDGPDTLGRQAVLEALVHLDRRQLANALTQIRDGADPRLAAALDLVHTSDEPVAATLAYLLLEHPRVAAKAMQAITERRDSAFVDALLDGISALDREGVLVRLREATHVEWLDSADADLAALTPARMKALVRFVSATGLDPSAQATFLCQLMGRTPPQGRLAILQAAADLPEKVARPVTRTALLDQDETVQVAAAQLVVDNEWSDRDRLLVGRLASPFEAVRHLVIRELSRYSFQRYLAAFDELDPTTRELAGRAVQRIDSQMLEHLADELHALDAKRRFRALQVVQTLNLASELAEVLAGLLNDRDRVVRATAIKVLGVVRTLDAMQAIIAALGDPDERVQANVIDVLESLHSEKFIGLLEPFLRHPNNRVRSNAARALLRLEYPPARGVLFGMLEEASEAMRLSAVWTLSALGSREPRIGSPQSTIQNSESEIETPVPGALARLERLALEDPSPRVRARAQEAVDRLRTNAAGTPERSATEVQGH